MSSSNTNFTTGANAAASTSTFRSNNLKTRIKKYSSFQQQQQQQQQRLVKGLYGRCGSNLTLMNYLNTRNWTTYTNVDVNRIACNHPPFMQRLDFVKRLPVHKGCVNTICWNKTGEYILSGSDDCNLCITKPGDMFDKREQYTVLHKVQTHHLGNIFCAQFIPNSADKRLVSCSSEGPIIVHDINSVDPSEGLLTFNCHSETIYEVVTPPDEDQIFLSCGEDKTIRLFDMRVHRSCARAGTCPHPALVRNSHAMTTLKLHPLNSNLMLVGRADGLGLVYDRRKLPDVTRFTREQAHAERVANKPSQSYQFKHPFEGVVSQFAVPEMEEKYRFTSLCYNRDGSQVLASYSGDYIYLFNHDKSSNFELIQTLPGKVSKSSTNESDGLGIGDRNSDNNDANQARSYRSQPGGDIQHGTGISANRSQGARTERSPRSARISRIRVRGDWSDTGVNSVPFSARSRNEPNDDEEDNDDNASNNGPDQADTNDSVEPRRQTSFLEQVAVTLRAHGASARQRPVPTEIVAGPINWDVVVGGSGDSSERRQEQTIEEEDEEEDGDEEEEEDADDDDENQDEDHDDDSTLIDEDERNSDDDRYLDEDIFRQYAEITAQNLVEEANDQAQRILNDGHSIMMDLDTDDHQSESNDSNSITSNHEDVTATEIPTITTNSTTTCQQRKGISTRTKEKFKKTLDDLKNKYNNIPSYHPRVKYQGHRNSRTSIKEAIFWGDDYIMSGSDCGRIMVWEKETAKLVMAFQADERVVNCLAPNPSTYVLASSGIDYDIKLWSTQGLKESPLGISESKMKRIIENNELMLEEAKYTLSVPPHLFFRVLASLVQSSR